MASRAEVNDLIHMFLDEDIQVVGNEAVNHHFLTELDAGTLQIRTVNGAVRAMCKYGEVQIEYTICVVRSVEADVWQPTACVSGTVRVTPMNDDYMSKDIFDDEWTFVGNVVHISGRPWKWPVAKVLAGVLRNVDEYYERGMKDLTPLFEW